MRNENTFTKHAIKRQQQRSIPPVIVDLLMDYGSCSPAGAGCERYEFTRKSLKKASGYLGPISKGFEKYISAYIIMSGATVITAGWRY